MGITTAIVGGLAAGFGASKLMSGGKQTSSAPLPLPQAPSVADAVGKAENISRKRKASQTQSVYTSPLGVSGEANVARKTLLGS